MEKTTYNLKGIPDGVAGIKATLSEMRKLVRQYKKNPSVRELTLRLVRRKEPKHWMGEIKAVHNFVRDKIRYVRDINGVETIQTPVQTLRLGQGDCDDQSILSAAMLESIGHPTRFVAISKHPGIYSHVFAETRLGDRWVSIECTEPVDVGWRPSGVLKSLIIHN